MARLEAVTPDRAGIATRAMYAIARRRFGSVPEPFAVTSHHPGLMRAAGIHEMLADRASTVLPAAVREIAVYRVAWTVGCSWCIDFGTMLQRLDGLDTERLAHIAGFETSDLYTDDEKAAIAYADAMTAQPMSVTDDLVAGLRAHLDEAELVELTFVIALENERSRFNNALGITAQGFTSGDTCAVPVTAAAAVPGSTSAG